MFTNSGIMEVLMQKDELKSMLEDYWYDNQYLKEKAKEVETMDSLIRPGKGSDFIMSTKKYEESEMSKIIEKKKYIEGLFQKLNQPYRTIMYMKYITFLTFDQIADRMSYSTKRIYQLHGEAIVILLKSINDSNISTN